MPVGDVAVVRWILVDERTNDTATVLLNPNEMTAPPHSRSFSRGSITRGAPRQASVETPVGIQAWSWSGICLTKAQYDMLEAWAKKPGIVRITDHLGRVFQVIMESFVPSEPGGRKPDSWRMKYTMNTQYLRRVS